MLGASQERLGAVLVARLTEMSTSRNHWFLLRETILFVGLATQEACQVACQGPKWLVLSLSGGWSAAQVACQVACQVA